eukprot:comp22641_c3_seq1/m.34860 comp22641_c3_seq1/g.34860  ORF comp22641_c3_seq1/g.34860 comp22641_c3_seq1/m.34860 type:complete len:115 (-) comp22641_c3_seq1:1314-1658(-)
MAFPVEPHAHFLSSLRMLHVERLEMGQENTAIALREMRHLAVIYLRATNLGLHAARNGDIDLSNLDCLVALYLEDEHHVSQVLLPTSRALKSVGAFNCAGLHIPNSRPVSSVCY